MHDLYLNEIAEATIEGLGLGSGVTLDELIRLVEKARGAEVRIVDRPMQGAVSGACFRSLEENCYFLLVNRNRQGHLRNLIIVHELIHILWGDVEKSVFSNLSEGVTALEEGQRGHQVASAAYRSGTVVVDFDPEREKEVEFVGNRVVQKIVTPQERAFNETWRNLFD